MSAKKRNRKRSQLLAKAKKRKQRKFAVLTGFLCLVIVLIVGHFTTRSAPISNVQIALNAANIRRESINRLDYSALSPHVQGKGYIIDDFMDLVETMDLESFMLFMSQLITPPTDDIASHIPNFMAIADVQALELLMRTQYGSYIYFGGDYIFSDVFNEIIDALSTAEYWSTSTGPDGDFMRLLHDNLFPFIADNHFRIGGHHLGISAEGVPQHFFMPTYADFFVSANDFVRSARGIRCTQSAFYLREIPGHNMDDMFRMGINDYGELVYVAVITVPEGNDEPIKLLTTVYENGEQGAIAFLRHTPVVQPRRERPTLEWIDGIPVVTVSQMDHFTASSTAGMLTSIAYGLRNEPVIILDIRSNIGGNSILPTHLFYLLVGEKVPPISRTLHIGNYDEFMYTMGAVTNWQRSPFTGQLIYHPAKAYGYYHFIIDYGPRRIVPSENLIIVLTDRFTSSAGERTVEMALSMNNALVIGQNTAGVYSNIAGGYFYLPNSGLPITFGLGTILLPYGLFSEGIGFAPDVWATGDALDAALALLRN